MFWRPKKIGMLKLLSVTLVVLMCGCAKTDSTVVGTETLVIENVTDNTVSLESDNASEGALESTAEIESETISLIGEYSLDECLKTNGLYMAYEDESFDWYSTGGYCTGADRGDSYFYGLFLENEIAENNPTITSLDNMVLVWDDNYYVTLQPVFAEIPVIQMEKEDGTKGFAYFSGNVHSSLKVHYRDDDWEYITIQTIDGMAPDDYEAEEVIIEVNPFSGIPTEVLREVLMGFKADSTVTLGIATGTTLKETTYEVDSIYYDCEYQHNHYSEEDIYYVQSVPTAQGYAKLDFSEIPSGKYVMVVHSNNKYKATIVEWQNSN